MGLHDEILRGNQPVVAGIDAASTYCHVLQGVEPSEADIWGVYPLNATRQGLDPDYIGHDVLSLAGPDVEERRELFDFIVAQLTLRERLALADVAQKRSKLNHAESGCLT